MNCSMSIFPYFYFSNNILFDFPSSGLIFCSWPGSDFGNIKRSIICKMRWRGTTWYNIIVMHISAVIGGKARYHIRCRPCVDWVSAVCSVHARIWTLTNAHGLSVLSNCYTIEVYKLLVRTRSTIKKLNHCLENQKGYYLRNRNTGECSCCNSSQDD